MKEPEHITDGPPCWCNPRVEHYDGGDVIIHRSLAEIQAATSLCLGCLYRRLADRGWCYMFQDMPLDVCRQWRKAE